jgi:hypothetical protein
MSYMSRTDFKVSGNSHGADSLALSNVSFLCLIQHSHKQQIQTFLGLS